MSWCISAAIAASQLWFWSRASPLPFWLFSSFLLLTPMSSVIKHQLCVRCQHYLQSPPQTTTPRSIFLVLSPVPVVERRLGDVRAWAEAQACPAQVGLPDTGCGAGTQTLQRCSPRRGLTAHTPLQGHPPFAPLVLSCSKRDEVMKTTEMHFLTHMWSQETEPTAGCRPGPATPPAPPLTRCP